jgi:hypothetical protein
MAWNGGWICSLFLGFLGKVDFQRGFFVDKVRTIVWLMRVADLVFLRAENFAGFSTLF